jgi:hypothetical protein
MTMLAPAPALATPTATTADDVWAWNAQRLEFDRLQAVRCAPDTWEIRRVPRDHGSAFDPGDLVHCELSDGELLVQSRVWSGRLL